MQGSREVYDVKGSRAVGAVQYNAVQCSVPSGGAGWRRIVGQ
jgi:hypothetical protein